MNRIELREGWKDQQHRELLANASESLAELGVLPREEAERIKSSVLGQGDD